MRNGSADKRLAFGFLLLLTAAALYLSFLIARPFLGAIITATLLAVAVYPLFTLLLRFVGKRSAAALLTTVAVFGMLLVPAAFLVNTLAAETKALYGWLSDQSSGDAGWGEYFTRVSERPFAWIEGKTGVSRAQLRSTAVDRLQDASAELLDWAKSLALNITTTIANTFAMLFTLFFLLRDGPAILRRVGSLLPLKPQRYEQLLKTIFDSIVANFYGVLAVALAQGGLGALGYWIAGLPNLMLWTVMTALLSTVPLVGATIVWAPAAIYLGATGHWGKALFMAIYGAGVISMADNVVRPLVLSGRVKLNTLLIFFSLLGGVKAFGVIGLFVGPIIVSVAMALLTILTEERAEWERDPAESG